MDALSLSIQLLNQADQAFYGPSWHGPCLLPTLGKLKTAEAIRPSPFEGYTPWGVALHAAYWKHRGAVLLAKASRGALSKPRRFFRSPADWPALPSPASASAWADDLQRIHEVHLGWRELIQAFPADLWGQAVRSDGVTAADLVFGVASHDLYHTAQIRNFGVKKFR